jgi:predicted nucleotidyltransferase
MNLDFVFMQKKLEIVREFKDALINEAKIKVKDVILFGSQAKNTATEDSDYDVLVVINEPETMDVRNRVADITFDLYMKYEIFFDAFIATKNEVNTVNNKTPLIDDAVNEGVYL